MNAPGDQALEVTPHPLLLQESDAPSKSKSSSSSSSSTSSSSSSEEEEDSAISILIIPQSGSVAQISPEFQVHIVNCFLGCSLPLKINVSKVEFMSLAQPFS